MKLTIGHFYPDLLNLYGDRGNISCLTKRLKWRGIDAQVKAFPAGSSIDFNGLDLALLGGGSDREQELVCRYLHKMRDRFSDWVEHGGVLLAVCGGYQLLGTYYQTEKTKMEGLNILNIRTEWKPGRLVGNTVLTSSRFRDPVVGFENHGGRTYIGEHTPLGQVRCGFGNDDASGYEGVLYKNVVATYLHGPLLPKNPEICDYLLERALRRRYGEAVVLEPLSDELERMANHYIAKRCCDE